MVQYCKLDRSTMYKIINGKRNPSSFELVQKMADFMCLTPAESKEFFKAYRISLIGRETYYRRKIFINSSLISPISALHKMCRV